MNHRATPRFWQCYRELPDAIQYQADRTYKILKRDPLHPSLRVKKVGRFWSARVGLRYRALAVEQEADLVWFWIGSHAEYDALLKRS